MAKLVVNPRSPSAWEIQLKPGTNLLGRGFANDFKIDDPSVSGSHCQIVVDQTGILIKDLGSTNGAYVDRAPVKEASLRAGQTVHLGGVEMLLQADAPAVARPPGIPGVIRLPDTEPTAPASPAGPSSSGPTVRLTRAAAAAPAAVAAPPPPLPTAHAAVPAVPHQETPAIAAGAHYCKFHPKTPARFLCNKCQRFFCELCVTTRGQTKLCRHCGAQCVPVQVHISRPVTKGFFRQLPGVLVYPFKGSGFLVLLVATIVFAALDVVSSWFFILLKMMVLGYMFSYMQNIIHSTAAEEKEMPSLPAFDGLFGSFFTFAAIVAFCFGLPIALLIAMFFFEVEIPMSAIITLTIVGGLYFPMAFLAVAMKDSVLAMNPVVVFSAIFKAPVEYFITAVLLTGVFGGRFVGNLLLAAAKAESHATRDMSVLFMMIGLRAVGAFVSIYLLTVSMRILGLLYVTKKHKFGWFSR